MSLELVQQVSAEHPELDRINLGSSNYQHTALVIAKLRAAGKSAQFICKTSGEGQVTPPGFLPREITGTDGRKYLCTGVSHDAIWCNGLQYDTLAKANDSEVPIFESDGAPMIAIPVWNAIQKEFWRPWNPPLLIDPPNMPTADPPKPPAPPASRVLPKGEAFARLTALNAFYAAPEGLNRPGGMIRYDNEGRSVVDTEAVAQWFYQMVIEGVSLNDVFMQIRASEEWRSKHPNA